MEDATFHSPNMGQGQKRSKFLIFFIASLLLIVGGFGAWQFFGTSNQQEEVEDSTPTPTEFEFPTDTPTPEASPTPEMTSTPVPTLTPTPRPTTNPVDKTTGLDRSDLTVEVQNGSGVAGAAAEASDILKTLGYNVTAGGNADNYEYTNVVIQVKSSESNFLELLKKDLGSDYTIGTTSANLSASASTDALVIIGK